MDPDKEQRGIERTNAIFSYCNPQMGENLLLASGEPGGSSSSATNAETAKPKKGTWLDTLHMNPKMYWPKKYRYTIEPTPGSVPVLSVRERDHYESNGYIIVRNLVPKEAQRQLSKLLTSAETLDHALSLFANSPQILRYAECFCGPNVMAMHKGWINHTPAEGMAGTLVRPSELTSTVECGQTSIQRSEETALHQDLFSLPFRPADRIVCALTLILPEPQSAAALSFLLALGSHRSSQMLTIDDDSMIIYEPVPRTSDDTSTRKQLLLNAGDTIFYHPLLSHALPAFAPGCSPASSVVSCHFASSECEYVIMSGHEALVPAHFKPISRIAVHPENKWKDKALLVKGKRITL